MRLVFPEELYRSLRARLLADAREGCAIIRAVPTGLNGVPRLLVREIYDAPDDAYIYRTAVGAELRPEFVASVVKLARQERDSLIIAHTHPHSAAVPAFSPIDDAAEKVLRGFVEGRIPDIPHLALVMSGTGCRARDLGGTRPADVYEIGSDSYCVTEQDVVSPEGEQRYDRQVLAFGALGQQRLRNLRIAIVGGGGTGSVAAQALAHLGVLNFLLIDGDVVDESSLNRMVGARTRHIGMAKVRVLRRLIRAISPRAQVEIVDEDVTYDSVARKLTTVDAIFCCTDTHASRAVLNQIAYQFMVPVFDMGVVIAVKDGVVKHVTGRAQMLAPGLACLQCANLIDPEAVRRELLSDEHRNADRYLVGAQQAQPAVITLNETVAGLAKTMFLSAMIGIPGKARALIYDGIKGTVRSFTCSPDPQCIVCSRAGAYGRGDSWPLPTRPVACPSRGLITKIKRATGRFWDFL